MNLRRTISFESVPAGARGSHPSERPAFGVLVAASVPPPITGQSVATAMLLRRLERAGVPHRVIDIGREFHTGRASHLRRALEVAILPARAALARRHLDAGPQVFYLQLGQSNRALVRDLPLITLAHALGIPAVVHIHGGGFRAAFDTSPLPLRRAVELALSRVKLVIVLTEGLRAMLDGLVEPDRVRVIANGVDQALAADARASRIQIDAGAPLTVLYLSNLIESKGYVDVLEAARVSAARGWPYRFVFAGSPTETTSVLPDEFARANRLDNIEYAGVVSGQDKQVLLRRAQAFVLPTGYPTEGQPIAVLEAMHYGLPIITTRQGGLPDVVTDGREGLLVAPRDPEAILQALERMSADRDLRRRIAVHNRQEARRRYTEAAHGQALLDALAEAALGRGG